MKEKPSPTFAKHLAAIEAGEITRHNIIGIRKLLNGSARRAAGWSVGMTTPLGTLEQADEILAAIAKHRPRVAGELHAGGLKVLRNPRHSKRLAPYADSIAALDHFRLVDFEELGSRGCYFSPIYRAETDDGRWISFRNIPWQSGGNGPEIIASGWN